MSKLNMNNEIKKVEKRIEQAIISKDPTLEAAAKHLFTSGGKRVRPAFAILSGQFGETESEDVYRVAVALELIHMATLVHDDVIDKSDRRRGRLTISKKWDQSTAILTGNFLLALGLEYISYIEDNRVHKVISHSIVDVCKGELFQFQDQFNSNQTITNYLRRINRKTALLIQLSTEVGAIAAGADIKTIHNLKMIGHYIGMSFQIVDDILDFTSTEKQLGKPVGSDLMNGHLTLPVLLEMKVNTEFKTQIAALSPESNKAEFEACINTIRQSNVIQTAQEISDKYLDKALSLIDELENDSAKPLFKKIIKKVGKRNV
ncbi:polyprenyl synthetase family protein [Staphylococcus gallinarum]|uniref:Heptaprenyl diphosphate synthase subunit II n=1 Tax=Staphylococcus gallinarum TaxID=1293 RepID=A0ABQ0Y193_STAGA|nr:polyprenyl synthetase family protein [Staphylococcus gallinarum]KIR11842.1 heptaprenyl diphosphate synthase [Staphylococcus gallinarum]MCD8902169.1 polyprenyl synthetase family protein [Staphylococcus gallinarum]MCD8908908.1 polyprenyl synthetase family protein [Staphylococcus gallinarum]MCD8919438.1 polyprenyl synthetase family protein [Staphylococcus gallinarum]MEB6236623.1 polyprenyl synthetase family protein [Staphylococcus gallinarum]